MDVNEGQILVLETSKDAGEITSVMLNFKWLILQHLQLVEWHFGKGLLLQVCKL